MADSVDTANDLAEMHRQNAINRIVGAGTPKTACASGFCTSCGDRIPSARALAVPGTTLCVFCADPKKSA